MHFFAIDARSIACMMALQLKTFHMKVTTGISEGIKERNQQSDGIRTVLITLSSDLSHLETWLSLCCIV